MNPGRLVIVDGVRTPFCRLGAGLAGADAVELGRTAVAALLARTGIDPARVDEVILGCVGQPADAANIARVIARRAGVPVAVPATTVQRNCASGLEAITASAEKLAAGQGEVFIVGGTESMSHMPLMYCANAAAKFSRFARARSLGAKCRAALSFRPRDFAPRAALRLGLTDPICDLNMGQTAEVLAREFGISRRAQDDWALASHQRAVAARDKIAGEIVPVHLHNGTIKSVSLDEGPHEGQTSEALARLRPAFDRRHGTVTPGNASQLTDGAVALLVMSERKADALELRPLGRLLGHAHTGCDPRRMGLGPVPAIKRCQERLGLDPARADLIEINEAFAAQVLAVLRTLPGLPRDCINVNGGAIALGHPVGATGARLVLTALKELRRRDGRRALVTLCVGGGQGSAAWLEGMP